MVGSDAIIGRKRRRSSREEEAKNEEMEQGQEKETKGRLDA